MTSKGGRISASQRLPVPGPSFVREETVRLPREPGGPERVARVAMSQPSIMEDGWWLTNLWVADEDGIVQASEVAPLAGPPPGGPLPVIGPSLAGALSGLLAQEDERQLIRLRMPPAATESRAWDRPLVCWLAVKWDPVRASVLRPNELARELLRAFAAAVEAAARTR